MLILRHPHHCPPAMKHSVIALGNFDGVHKGHQQVINTARRIAAEEALPSAVMTFEPHPVSVFKAEASAMRITPFRMKALQIQALLVDSLCVLQFSEQFSQLTAEQFVWQILVDAMKIRHIVVGEDFNFGRNRSGNAVFLKQMAAEYGFGVSCVKQVIEAGQVCSSSNIRQCIRQGKMEEAAQLLGHHYTLTGKVHAGDKRGRLLGFPTANIQLHKEQLRPLYGVYAVKISLNEGEYWYNGVANLGQRPSFTSPEERFEVHIFGFDGDIYDKRVQVKFLKYLRPEQQFSGLEALKAQIVQDSTQAQTILEAMDDL